MGFFNFSKYNDMEKAMLDMYSQMLSMRGIPSSEAKKLTEDMLDQAIEESKKMGLTISLKIWAISFLETWVQII